MAADFPGSRSPDFVLLLAPLARLALAYAPASAREDWLTLLALDARLSLVVRQSREPVLGQIRLAWWRDKLAALGAEAIPAEPLLARIGALDGAGQAGAALAGLVNGWEALLAEPPLLAQAANEFAAGRAQAAAWLAARHGVDPALAEALARRWALADLALHLGDAGERAAVGALLQAAPDRARAPRALRPLAILDRVTVRAWQRADPAGLTSPAALALALRIGLIGQ